MLIQPCFLGNPDMDRFVRRPDVAFEVPGMGTV